jgi:uncharacterized protein (DUF433 family)
MAATQGAESCRAAGERVGGEGRFFLPLQGIIIWRLENLGAEEVFMGSVIGYPHIDLDAKGVARIGQTRYKVLHLAAEHFHYGWSAEELLRQHPDLRPEEVYAALT